MLRGTGCSFLEGKPATASGRIDHVFVFSLVEIKEQVCHEKKMWHLRYKMRPKFHAFHCQIILHASSGASLNVKYGSCFNEEDLIGKVTRVTKGSLHASTVCKRVLQRWLLQMNAHLCERVRVRLGTGVGNH